MLSILKRFQTILKQVAQAINSIPSCAILAFVTTLIIISMTGFRKPVLYFLTMFLALLNAEALNQLVSYGVPHFIIGIALVAGVSLYFVYRTQYSSNHISDSFVYLLSIFFFYVHSFSVSLCFCKDLCWYHPNFLVG